MKILHVITSLYTGGAEKLMVDLLPRLAEKGVAVDLLLFDGTPTPFREEAERKGIKIIDFGKGHSPYSLKNLIKLIPLMKKYDIVHTHNTSPQLFAAIGSMFGSAVLCTTEHSTSNRRRNSKWYKPIDRWMYSRYKSIIGISEKTSSLLQKSIKIDDGKVVTINNGIDLTQYNSDSYNEIKENSTFKICQVAGFRYQKDQDTVIKSLLYLPTDVHLYLIGDGERRNILEELSLNLELTDRVHFMGIRSDIPSLLNNFNMTVMSSHLEGFGLAAVEAMAAGTPVIASNVDGLKEVVEGAGILFEHENAEDLANKILMLKNNKTLYKEVAAKCLLRAQNFDINKMTDAYLNVYNEVLTTK